MTNSSILPEDVDKSLTAINWYVWEDKEDDPEVRPATPDEIRAQVAPEGYYLVSDPMTVIVNSGKILIDGRMRHSIPSTNRSISIIQRGGANHDNIMAVYFQTEEDVNRVIDALIEARDFIYKA